MRKRTILLLPIIFLFSLCTSNIPISGGHDLPNLIKIKIDNKNIDKITKISLYNFENNNFIKIADSTISNTDSINFQIQDKSKKYIAIAYNSDSSLGAISFANADSNNNLNLKETSSIKIQNIKNSDDILIYPYPKTISPKTDSLLIEKIPAYTYNISQTTDTGTIFTDYADIQPKTTTAIDIEYIKNNILIWNFNEYNFPEYITENCIKIDSNSRKIMNLPDMYSRIKTKNDVGNIFNFNKLNINLDFSFNKSDIELNKKYSLLGISNSNKENILDIQIEFIGNNANICVIQNNITNVISCELKDTNYNKLQISAIFNADNLQIEFNDSSYNLINNLKSSNKKSLIPFIGYFNEVPSLNMKVYNFSISK